MKKNSDRTLTAVVVAVVLLALIGFGIAVQNVDQIFPEIASATPKPQPISKTVALPSFLDGCLRHEENTLTITEMDGMVSLLQKYRCEVNELTEADKQLLAQGIPSINTQEVHFSMEIQAFFTFLSGRTPEDEKPAARLPADGWFSDRHCLI